MDHGGTARRVIITSEEEGRVGHERATGPGDGELPT